MFSGIIQSTSPLTHISKKSKIVSVTLKIPQKWTIQLGQSIAINGICSTVSRKNTGKFTVDYMPETLRKTTVGNWKVGDFVNLEKSLRLGDELGGHFVMGHIDTVGKIQKITQEGDARVLTVTLPKEHLRYIVYKGSIAVDGISLTVSAIVKNGCTVSLIPFTLTHTNLAQKKSGDYVNIELDIVAKYVDQLRKHTP